MARILKTARSGRAVRFPKIIRKGEKVASLTSVMQIAWQKLYHLHFVLVKNGTAILVAKNEQELCRSPVAMFRLCKVFNTGVENSVQKRARRHDNSSFFNTVMRFAQFLCNESTAGRIFLRCSGRKIVKRFVWEKNAKSGTNFLPYVFIPQ